MGIRHADSQTVQLFSSAENLTILCYPEVEKITLTNVFRASLVFKRPAGKSYRLSQINAAFIRFSTNSVIADHHVSLGCAVRKMKTFPVFSTVKDYPRKSQMTGTAKTGTLGKQ